MVYPGHRSTGCIECRRRKVKCDSTKPQCRRCTLRSHECPGYPDKFSFRPLPTEVAKAGPRGRPNRSDTSNTTTKSPSQPGAGQAISLSKASTRSPSIPPSPATHWEQHSLSFFADQYILPSVEGVSSGYLSFVPDLYHVENDQSCLKSAMLAVSYLTLYNRTGSAQLYVTGRDSYGSALSRINTALNDPESILTDETLASIVVLTLFVDVNNERQNLLNVHSLGIYRLVKLQRNQLVRSKKGLYLFSWAVSHLLIQSFIRGQERYVQVMDLLNLGDLQSHDLKFARVTCKIFAFRSLVKQFTALRGCMSGSSCVQEVNDMTGVACHLLSELDAWDRDMPEDWKYLASGLPCEDLDTNPAAVQWIVAFLTLVSSARVIFYLSLMEWCNVSGCCLPSLRTSLGLEEDTSIPFVLKAQIHQQLRNIAKSAHDTIRESNDNGLRSGSAAVSHIVLWPTWMVAHCPFSTPDLVAQSRQTLNIIGNRIGVKLAVSMYTPDFGPIDQFS